MNPTLTYADISAETGITAGALRKRLSLGTMPKPDYYVGKTPVWRRTSLTEWLPGAKPGPGTGEKKPCSL